MRSWMAVGAAAVALAASIQPQRHVDMGLAAYSEDAAPDPSAAKEAGHRSRLPGRGRRTTSL